MTAGRRRLVALAATLAVAASSVAAASARTGDDGDRVVLGRELYVTDCASCHGFDGEGIEGVAPSLEDAGPAAVHFYVSSGRMPMADLSQQSRRKPVDYDAAEVAALVAYVSTLGEGPDIPELDLEGADLAEGNLLYTLHCAACHNSAGSGGALGQSIFVPPVYPATAVQVAEAVRVGPGAMPAFGPGVIDDAQLDDLVAYVEFLDDPVDRGGASLGRVGPVPEGLVAWIIGLGVLLLAVAWIGTREPRA